MEKTYKEFLWAVLIKEIKQQRKMLVASWVMVLRACKGLVHATELFNKK